MKPPATIVVLGVRIDVAVVGRMPHDHLLGTFLPREDRIEILDEQAAQSERDTVLHEVMHVADTYLALKMTEGQVQRLTVALLGAIRDNPELVAYLTTPLPEIPA